MASMAWLGTCDRHNGRLEVDTPMGKKGMWGYILFLAWLGPGEVGEVHVCYTRGGVLGQKKNKGTYKGVLNHSIHSNMPVQQHMDPK